MSRMEAAGLRGAEDAGKGKYFLRFSASLSNTAAPNVTSYIQHK